MFKEILKSCSDKNRTRLYICVKFFEKDQICEIPAIKQ